MARLTSVTWTVKGRQTVHRPVLGGVSVFERDGHRYLQLDTYGTAERQDVGGVSQSLQLDREAARLVRDLIDQTFEFEK